MKEEDVLLMFGARLRAYRLKQGHSQEVLASMCGLDRTYISGVERGRRNISLLNIYRLAKALKLSPGSLFSEEGVRSA